MGVGFHSFEEIVLQLMDINWRYIWTRVNVACPKIGNCAYRAHMCSHERKSVIAEVEKELARLEILKKTGDNLIKDQHEHLQNKTVDETNSESPSQVAE